MESNIPPTIAKRLRHIVRVAYYMLRKGVSKRKFIMLDLHLLFKRGKLAGEALGHFITFHYHQSVIANSDRYLSAFLCRSLDSNKPFYDPKGVEFSCSNTPSHGSSTKWKTHRQRQEKYVAMAAKPLEILNYEVSTDVESVISSAMPTPSPILWLAEKSPIVRQLRITDSPFLIQDHEMVDVDRVNKEAEEFIKMFYEQLGRQQLASAAAVQICKLPPLTRSRRA